MWLKEDMPVARDSKIEEFKLLEKSQMTAKTLSALREKLVGLYTVAESTNAVKA